MPPIEGLKKIVKAAGLVFISLIFSKALTYSYRLIVARIGVESYGILSIGIIFLGLANTLSLLGLSTGVVRYVSYYRGKESPEGIKGAITSGLKISLFLSLLTSAAIFLTASWISTSVFNAPALVPVLRIFAIIVPFSALSLILLNVLIAFEKVKYYVSVKNILESIVLIVSTAVIIYLGYGILGAAIAYALAIVSTFLISLYLLEKRVFPIFRTTVKSAGIGRELLYYSWPLTFTGLLSTIIGSADSIMIGYFLTVSDTGIYNAAVPTASLLFLVSGPMLTLFMPIIAESYGRGEIKELKAVYRRIAKWIFFINFPIVLLIAAFSKEILNILFGSAYAAGSSALIFLIIGYFIYSIFEPSRNILLVIKKTKLLLLASIIATVLNIIFNYLLIPVYGITGGAIATCIAFSISGIIYGIFTYQFMKIHPVQTIYVRSIFAGILSLLVLNLLNKALTLYVLPKLIVLSLLFLTSYLLLLIVFKGLEEEDIEIIKIIIKKFKIR
ncbi:MAG: flippase [Methanobacteriota archaeon]